MSQYETVDVHNLPAIIAELEAERLAYYADYISLMSQAKKDAVAEEAEDFLTHFMGAIAAKTNADKKRSLIEWYERNRFEKETLDTFTAREEYLTKYGVFPADDLH